MLTSIITSGTTTYFGFLKEKSFSNTKYTERVLTELYIPIYKILNEHSIPMIGYYGIDENQMSDIKVIIDRNPELVDPKLNKILEEYMEIAFFNVSRVYEDQISPKLMRYDENLKLYTYILFAFNKTRRSLGLPSDKRYNSKISILYIFLYRVYRNFKRKKDLKKFGQNWKKFVKVSKD